MKGKTKEVKVVYLTVAVDNYKKWWVLNSHYNEEDALRYLDVAQKVYPEYNDFFVHRYVRSGIVAEIHR